MASGMAVSFADWVEYIPQVWERAEADALFARLQSEIKWQQGCISVFGKTHPMPRLTAWYADEGKSYRYSGVYHPPQNFTSLLDEIRLVVEAQSGVAFNSVLLNLYRDGQDSNGWHADDEPEMDSDRPIASVSFGQQRRFRMRSHGATSHIDLEHGSLLIMRAGAQQKMQHCLPKSARKMQPRVNLTFRVVV